MKTVLRHSFVCKEDSNTERLDTPTFLTSDRVYYFRNFDLIKITKQSALVIDLAFLLINSRYL